jgi:hypothetical protein
VGDRDAPLGQEFLDVSEAEREAQIHPDGTLDDVAREAVAGVREQVHADRLRRRAEHGKAAERDKPFSGEGNAIFKFDGAPEGSELSAWVQDQLPHLAFEAKDMTWDLFAEKLAGMGGIVEEFLEAKVKRSPSVQFRVGRCHVVGNGRDKLQVDHVRRRHRQHSAMPQTPRLERAGAYELKRDGGEG